MNKRWAYPLENLSSILFILVMSCFNWHSMILILRCSFKLCLKKFRWTWKIIIITIIYIWREILHLNSIKWLWFFKLFEFCLSYHYIFVLSFMCHWILLINPLYLIFTVWFLPKLWKRYHS
jgi:hypothetical protein